MKTVLTGDLGGTKCRFGILAEDLTIHGVRRVSTPTDQEAFIAMLVEEFGALKNEVPPGCTAPEAIGIGAAGVITTDGRSVVYAPNLFLDGVHVADILEDRVGLPTALINDGRASALGEYRHGFAAGADPLLVLFFGTGIGIGLVVHGAPYMGGTNAAGEVGHLEHVPDGRPCPCGRKGCFEAYCGGRPMVERAAAEIGPAPGGAAKWTVGDIVAHAETHPAASQILEDAALAAGSMVQSLCTLLNPSAVVLGGGVLQGWPALRDRIQAQVQEWCDPVITKELRFVSSKGESDAILWGAAETTGVFR